MDYSINGKTKVFGLIGKGISGSLSPFIHNTLNEYLNINSVYLCFETSNILNAVKGGEALGIEGFNVTTPYKLDVIPLLNVLDNESVKLNSVNTLVKSSGGYKGYNTDYYGFYKLLEVNNIELRSKEVLVIGAGGSSHTICKVLDDYGVEKLQIANRTIQNAYKIKSNIKNIKDVTCTSLNDIEKYYDIIIQTTTIGFGENKNSCPINLEKIKGCKYSIDIIYGKKYTPFLNKCSDNGMKTVDGLDMLFYQAVKAYEIFNNIVIDESILLKCKEKLYKKVYE